MEIFMVLLVTISSGVGCCLGSLIVNLTDKEPHSVYPKFILRRLVRGTPYVKIIRKPLKGVYIAASDDQHKYIIRVYPYKYSFAFCSDTFYTNPYKEGQEWMLERIYEMKEKAVKKVQKKQRWNISSDEIDMWEL